jgi:hypothetical protein
VRTFVVAIVVTGAVALPSSPAVASVPWSWPVTGAIVRGFDPPDSPYGAGHRGIDIAAPVGTTILAPMDGVVSFAGPVGGKLFLTIDHGGGVTSTCSWLTSLLVRKGAHVARGQPVATTGWGHADLTVPHLHFSVRLDGVYVDPLVYLSPIAVSSFIRLAPLDEATAGLMAPSRMTSLAYPTSALRAVRRDLRRPGGGSRVRASRLDGSMAAVPGRAGARRRRVGIAGSSVQDLVASRRGHR